MENQVTGVRAKRPQAAPWLAARRLPLLAGALLALIAGLWGALGLLDLDVPLPRTSFAQNHGALMALGFLGTLISLERSVALGRPNRCSSLVFRRTTSVASSNDRPTEAGGGRMRHGSQGGCSQVAVTDLRDAVSR